MTKAPLTARSRGWVSCPICHLVCRMPKATPHDGLGICPRCHAKLHQRKPNSLSRTWALLLAASILYIPANIYPITIITTFGREQADTIMSGVIYFIQTGTWPIALVIFVASILVPLLKLIILIFLLISVQIRSKWRPRERTRLYLFIEIVGRWSMVDIYVVTILVALVNMGAVAKIEAGPGAIYFAAVVVITMFAASSFDPRIIWDV